jgi:hypothetical protein
MIRALLLALLLTGCAASPPARVSESLGAAYISADRLVLTAFDLCYADWPGGRCHGDAALTTEQRDQVRRYVLRSTRYLRQARELLLDYQEAQAMQALSNAHVLLRNAEAIIAQAQL